MKKTVPLAVGFVSGLLVILKYFGDNPILNMLGTMVTNWRVTVAAFALGLGAVNLIQIHGRAVIAKSENRDSSILLLGSLAVFTVLGLTMGPGSPVYKWCWDNVYQPIYSGIASLLAFMIISASYRAFKIRNWQSTVLMVSAVIVMLGQIGVGSAISRYLPSWSQWIMSVPNTAGMRGISIGGALGAIALSIRVLLGFERSYMGGGQQ